MPYLDASNYIKKVAVSALAVLAMPVGIANAVVQVTCPGANRLQIGRNVACGNGNFFIRPAGTIQLNGCVITLNAPAPARCRVFNFGAPTSRDVRISFDPTPITFNDGGNLIRLTQMRAQRTTGGPSAAVITLTSGEVNASVFINVGARVNFLRSNAIGNYIGTITVTATPL